MTRPVRLLILFALFTSVLLASAGAAGAATLTPVTFGDSYRHVGVTSGGEPYFAEVAFDDSSWSVGNTPFGTTCGFSESLPAPTGTGGWPLAGDLLLRKTFTVPAGTGAGSITVLVDNDVEVYLNGGLVGSAIHENCADNAPPAPFTFPAGTLNAGANVLAIRAADRGGDRYIDAKLEVDLVDADTDGDGVLDLQDNCPLKPNAGQADADNDGRGDVCDGYEVTITPGSIFAGERRTLTATITSRSDTGNLTDATLTAPSPVKVVSASQGTVSGQQISLSGLNLADGQSTTVDVTVDAACLASSGNWSSSAAVVDEGTNHLTRLSPVQTSTVTGGCSLSFTTQPQDARTNALIRGGADFDPAGTPFVVTVLAANGETSVGSVVPIALAIGPTSTGLGTVSGTIPVVTTAGQASFSNVKINSAGTYRLVASTSGIPSATSVSFVIADAAVSCPPSGCSGSVTTPNTAYTVQATSTGSSSGNQFLKIGVNDGPPLDCAFYTERNPDTLTVDLNSATLEKLVTMKLSKAVVNSYGKQRIDVCFSAPYLFLPRPFTLLTWIKYDSDANGVAETWFVGRLPNCLNYDSDSNDREGWEPRWTRLFPCVTKRRKQTDGTMLIGVRMPARAEDPRMR